MHGIIGVGAGILHGIILCNLGFGLLYVFVASGLFASIIGGLLDDIMQIKENKKKGNFVLKGVVVDLVGFSLMASIVI